MATVEGDGGPGADRWRGRGGGRGSDRGRGGDCARPPTGHAAAGDAACGVRHLASPSRRPPPGHAAAGDAASVVSQVASASSRANPSQRPPPRTGHAAEGIAAARVDTPVRLPSDGPGATTSRVLTNSPESRQTAAEYDDADIEEMKKYIQKLELKNAELRQKLEAAHAQLKEGNRYINSNPVIDEELRKCHDVFLCPNESKYTKLPEFLSDPQSKLTMDVNVHGKIVVQALKQLEKDLRIYTPKGARVDKKELKKFRRMTVLAKCIILGIIEDIYRLHRHGLSLNGKFTIDNFYWTHLKKVKFDPTLKLIVCKRDRSEMINDFHQIYQIILEMLSFNDRCLSIPHDLQSLLDLLNSDDPVKHHQIIRYNMSLLSEIGKKSHFITLYDRLQQQIREDDKKKPEEEKKSEKVLQVIITKFRHPGNGSEPWSNMAKENSYVGAIYDLRSANKNMVLEGPLDLLIVWRNALSHILEDSVKDGASLFKDEDLVNILESTIPGIFNELQIAMSEVGLVELPHLMRAMRM